MLRGTIIEQLSFCTTIQMARAGNHFKFWSKRVQTESALHPGTLLAHLLLP